MRAGLWGVVLVLLTMLCGVHGSSAGLTSGVLFNGACAAVTAGEAERAADAGDRAAEAQRGFRKQQKAYLNKLRKSSAASSSFSSWTMWGPRGAATRTTTRASQRSRSVGFPFIPCRAAFHASSGLVTLLASNNFPATH